MHIHTVVNALQLRNSIMNKELDSRWLKYMPGWEKIPLNIQASSCLLYTSDAADE